jgi:N utilization substance protein B
MPFNRRRTRERVLQVLYAYEITHDPIDDILPRILKDLESTGPSWKFATTYVHAVLEHADEYDVLIKGQVEHWEFDRLAILDKLILRMAICEFLIFDDIPPKVTLNEAIEIARSFSTEKSDKFVNGVLDSLLETFRKDEQLHKRGRGLVEGPTTDKRASS